MKMKEIPYFTRSVDRAEKRFADYKARTEAQARNLGFVCAGNLGKGSRNRLNTITDKSVRLYSAYTLRRLFLKMYRLEDNSTRIFWAELNDILRICQTEASPFHNYDYSSFAWDDSDLEDKYNAVRHFIDQYGTATDKKYLLPKFIIRDRKRELFRAVRVCKAHRSHGRAYARYGGRSSAGRSLRGDDRRAGRNQPRPLRRTLPPIPRGNAESRPDIRLDTPVRGMDKRGTAGHRRGTGSRCAG